MTSHAKALFSFNLCILSMWWWKTRDVKLKNGYITLNLNIILNQPGARAQVDWVVPYTVTRYTNIYNVHIYYLQTDMPMDSILAEPPGPVPERRPWNRITFSGSACKQWTLLCPNSRWHKAGLRRTITHNTHGSLSLDSTRRKGDSLDMRVFSSGDETPVS